jgi:hypothetical protein
MVPMPNNGIDQPGAAKSIFLRFPFPLEELPQKTKLDTLMASWKKETAKHIIVDREDGKTYPADSYFASDGFLPYYFHQKYKVLFIARETRYIAGRDNIEVLMEKCKDHADGIGAESVLRRMLLIAYGIQTKGLVPFENINLQELCALAGTIGGFSFALMEISKYSNENDDGDHADTILMQSFFEHSNLTNQNFIQEELSLLDPDIVITMNLWDGKIADKYLSLALGDVPFIECPPPGNVARRSIKINDKIVPLIDTYHFSARKNDKSDYYESVIKMLREL